jgi:hypothetical protein
VGLYLIPKVGTKKRVLYDQFLMVILTDLESCGLWMHRKFVDLALHFRNLKLVAEMQENAKSVRFIK